MYKQAIIILGCGIDAEGNLGKDPKGSVQLGIEAYQKLDAACLIMTGNVSYKATFKPSISEAQAMKDYAVSLSIPADKIFIEAESKDTLGNLVFTKHNLLAPLHIRDITIIRGPNQSTERISYLAAKVLGAEYAFTIIGPSIQRPNEQLREERSFAQARQWLDPIKNGDSDAIYKLMREKHPGYNSSLSLDELQQLL